MQPLFSIPIATGGSFECASPTEKVYLLSFESPPDNRLTTAFIDAFLLSLDIIELKYPPGVVITTSKVAKFYSNGLDLKHTQETPDFAKKKWYPFYERILTYPMPTIALINGHAFAGGYMLAQYHDYRVQNPAKGFLCLNEIDIGIPLWPPLISVFQEKVPSSTTLRAIILEGKRFGAQEALKEGLVDTLGGLDEALRLVKERNLLAKTKTGIYGVMKEDMYRESIRWLRDYDGAAKRRDELDEGNERRKEKGRRDIAAWEKSGGGSKL